MTQFIELSQSEIAQDFPSALKLMLKNVFAIDETRGLWLQHTNGNGKGGADKYIINAYEGLNYKHTSYADIRRFRVIFRAYSNEEALLMVNENVMLVKRIARVFGNG